MLLLLRDLISSPSSSRHRNSNNNNNNNDKGIQQLCYLLTRSSLVDSVVVLSLWLYFSITIIIFNSSFKSGETLLFVTQYVCVFLWFSQHKFPRKVITFLLSYGEAVWFLWGANWVFKYSLTLNLTLYVQCIILQCVDDQWDVQFL